MEYHISNCFQVSAVPNNIAHLSENMSGIVSYLKLKMSKQKPWIYCFSLSKGFFF